MYEMLELGAAVLRVGDPSSAGDDELLDAAVALERLSRQVDAARAEVVAELEERCVTDARHGMRTAAWVARQTSGSERGVRRRIRLGSILPRWFPVLWGAVSAGDLSTEHAEVVCRAAIPRIREALSALDAELVDLARVATFDRFAAEFVGLARLLDADGGHRPDRPSALTLSPTVEGVAISGHLDELDGLVTCAAIDRVVDDLRLDLMRRREAGDPTPFPTPAQLRAHALVELCRRADAVDPTTTRAPVPEVTVVLRTETGTVSRLDGTTVTDGVARLLCCDAGFLPLLVDDAGSALHVGRRTRRVTPTLRHALVVRDGGCVFPGCSAPAGWCDGHHVQHWSDGGPTDVENLALLCRYHHGVVHRSGWAMRHAADQRFTFVSPTGERLRSQRHQQRAGP